MEQKSKTHKVNAVGVGDKPITRKAEGNTHTEDQVRVSLKVTLHASLALVPSVYYSIATMRIRQVESLALRVKAGVETRKRIQSDNHC